MELVPFEQEPEYPPGQQRHDGDEDNVFEDHGLFSSVGVFVCRWD
jgi:hypothetical protein